MLGQVRHARSLGTCLARQWILPPSSIILSPGGSTSKLLSTPPDVTTSRLAVCSLGVSTIRHLQTSTIDCTDGRRPSSLNIMNETYITDKMTNVSPRVLSKVGRNLHRQKFHPLNLIHSRITNYFYKNFLNRYGTPIFAVFDNICPVVTIQQNFDSLLVPQNHISRSQSDTYYVNSSHLLRSHTSAHQEELIKMGFDTFLVSGDVYRRDEIDSSHYPVFHQMEGVRLFSEEQIFSQVSDPTGLYMFDSGKRTDDKQETHTVDAVKLIEHDLKKTLTGLAKALFGPNINTRWEEVYFPFTHPSWELEIEYHGIWLEVLGCGIMEQKILTNAGVGNKMGWAFGLGLERLAMKLYDIPDIRLFWSQDKGFLNQFHVADPETNIKYKPISQFPPCINDLSFWIPDGYTPNDFYDLVRSVGGDVIEQVSLIDEFTHPRLHKTSHCYRITYRHMEKTFTQDEVNVIHGTIEKAATDHLGVEVRTK